MNYLKNSYELGKRGEAIAQSYLKKQNYIIILNNFRVQGGEIDIIAQKDSMYIFTEVKTRKNSNFGTPEEAFDIYKQKHIKRTIKCFFSEISGNCLMQKQMLWRCDLISIYIGSNNFGILKHFTDVFDE